MSKKKEIEDLTQRVSQINLQVVAFQDKLSIAETEKVELQQALDDAKAASEREKQMQESKDSQIAQLLAMRKEQKRTEEGLKEALASQKKERAESSTQMTDALLELDAHYQEKQKQLDKKIIFEEAKQAELDAAEAQIAEERSTVARELEDLRSVAEQAAEDIRAGAVSEKEEMLRQAQVESDAILESGRAQTTREKAAAQVEIDHLKSRIDYYSAQINEITKTIEALLQSTF